MIRVGLGVFREEKPGAVNLPCVHPPYALVYKSEHSLAWPVEKTPSEDIVYCERCWALLVVSPDGA
jgi:hypothetical protein